jgi:hypothetical protein
MDKIRNYFLKNSIIDIMASIFLIVIFFITHSYFTIKHKINPTLEMSITIFILSIISYFTLYFLINFRNYKILKNFIKYDKNDFNIHDITDTTFDMLMSSKDGVEISNLGIVYLSKNETVMFVFRYSLSVQVYIHSTFVTTDEHINLLYKKILIDSEVNK